MQSVPARLRERRRLIKTSLDAEPLTTHPLGKDALVVHQKMFQVNYLLLLSKSG